VCLTRRCGLPLMWACINRRSIGLAPGSNSIRGHGGNTAVSFSGCGRWSRHCQPRSWRSSMGAGERGSYVSVALLTHSCRTFHPPPSPRSTPTPQQLGLGPHLQLEPQQHQLLLHNLQSKTPTTTTTIPPRPRTIAAPVRNILRTATATNRRFPFFILRRSYSSATMAESELKWPAARVRKTFLEYFEQRGHTIGMYAMR
jgi:hypothetical protein